jgi:Cdc6-like AAA superfamily ATPase
MSRSQEEIVKLRFEASKVFSPSAPIDEQALFAGRTQQVAQVIDAINQRGQHAIIFGERGVGKTSLANVLTPWLESLGERVVAPRVNCDSADTFSSVWRKMFSEFQIARQTRRPGFKGEAGDELVSVADGFADEITPDDVRRVLTSLGWQTLLVVVFDEFDRLTDRDVQRLFADIIKALSDHSVRVTLVLVGVADTVDQLIEEHQSVERALVQIRMMRMSRDELHEIVNKGLTRLGMTIENDALEHIAALSQGLPHYTHLLGLYACRDVLDHGDTCIRMVHVESAIKKAVDGAQQTIQNAYLKATTSSRRDNLYSEVLLACALAKTDEFGYFAAADIREPLKRITGKGYDIPSFSQHLNNFCESTRGPILHRIGVKHRFRFRFENPLMQPFVTLRGFSNGKISRAMLERST